MNANENGRVVCPTESSANVRKALASPFAETTVVGQGQRPQLPRRIAPLDGCPKPGQTHNESTWSTQGNLITLGKGSSEEMVYEWTVKDDMLSFTYRSGSCIPCRAGDTANPWKRVK